MGVARIAEYGPLWRRLGWLVCFFYAAAAALRLARFNSRSATQDKHYFEGLPSPSVGDEDHLGDMDFKVAGTEEGVTSLQMDIKIAGITEEIMKVALAQARDGMLHILGEMAKAIATSARNSVSSLRASKR